ncbi:unnamed protein product [Urochloa humidicola]
MSRSFFPVFPSEPRLGVWPSKSSRPGRCSHAIDARLESARWTVLSSCATGPAAGAQEARRTPAPEGKEKLKRRPRRRRGRLQQAAGEVEVPDDDVVPDRASTPSTTSLSTTSAQGCLAGGEQEERGAGAAGEQSAVAMGQFLDATFQLQRFMVATGAEAAGHAGAWQQPRRRCRRRRRGRPGSGRGAPEGPDGDGYGKALG